MPNDKPNPLLPDGSDGSVPSLISWILSDGRANVAEIEVRVEMGDKVHTTIVRLRPAGEQLAR